MGKQTKQSREVSGAKKEKSSSTFQIVLLGVFMTLLFVSAVTLIIAKFADVNVFDKANEWSKNLPFISEKKEEEGNKVEIMGDPILEERVVTLQAEIQEKEAQFFKLQQDLEKSSNDNEKLLNEHEKLLDEIALLVREKDDSKRKFKEIVSTFEKMSAKSAAPVIMKMSDPEAIRILTNLKSDTLAAVLEKMPPENAAKYTMIMTTK